MQSVLTAAGVPETQHTRGTPRRVARFVLEWCRQCAKPPRLTTFESSSEATVEVNGVKFMSMCAHHLLPFVGEVRVVYRPAGRVVGLSKVARLTEHFAHRLQVQEDMTQQVFDALWAALTPTYLLVEVRAEHLCMTGRGVKAHGAGTITRLERGVA